MFGKNLYWTQHSKMKMRQYSLSKSRVLRVLYNPNRKEKGIVPKTTALMQPVSKTKKKGEVWLMYQDRRKMRIIITAWRYPGVSPIGEVIPIPEDIRQFLQSKKGRPNFIDNF